ncbi:hypothetical protein K474DRAFT_1440543 [Panus rudis PR-1116 ss-1]|nr:hypothetical protein K474DRAFT_1440543 [Panus rudis PR-1116 ss-1]
MSTLSNMRVGNHDLNATRRTSILPADDILANVFVLLITTLEDIPSEQPRLSLTISQVCRTWRRVALATPSLWCTIDTHRPKLIPLYLERSRPRARYDRGIHVYWSPRADYIDPSFHLQILPHAERITKITLELWSHDTRPCSVLKKLGPTLQNVKTLHISADCIKLGDLDCQMPRLAAVRCSCSYVGEELFRSLSKFYTLERLTLTDVQTVQPSLQTDDGWVGLPGLFNLKEYEVQSKLELLARGLNTSDNCTIKFNDHYRKRFVGMARRVLW